MEQKTIGEFIQISRKDKGLTQKQLGDKIGVSDKTISKWENGLSSPDTSILLSLCSVLEISVNELISGKKISPEDYSKEAEDNIMQLWRENIEQKKTTIGQYILAAVFGLAAIVFTLVSLQFRLAWYFDIPSLIMPAFICLAAVFLSGKKTKYENVRLARKVVIPAGLFVSVAGLVSILGNLVNLEKLGANMAICMLSTFYSIVAYIVLLVVEEHSR